MEETFQVIVRANGMILSKANPGYHLWIKTTEAKNYLGKFRDRRAAERAFRKVKRGREQLTLDFLPR